ncbi:MAG: putative glycoside hydrolase [Lachnospiraceae bacterium]|nr:putative glycoside hydrolase [Lachnospiraceae bacterium]
MNDMYIDYGGERRRKRRRKNALIVTVIAAVVIGLAGFFGTRYYFRIMEEQSTASADDQRDSSPAQAMEDDESNPQTGIYGFWYSPTQTEEEAVPDTGYAMDDDVWMADFDDRRERVDAKGIYVSSAYINKKLNDAIELVDETELNAMVIDIKSDAGYITYQMDYDVAKEIGACSATIGNIESTVKKLKDHGVYLIARVVTLKDPILAEKKPELALYNNDGTLFRDRSGLAWVNPYEDAVWDYLIEVCKQCVAVGFDEVNLDYIRFSTDKGMANVNFGPKAEEMTRIEVITSGIKRICEEIKPLGAFVSCDVYGAIMTSSVDARIVGQSYFQMAQYLDYICPMVYPSHYADGYYNLDYPDCHPYELVYQALMASQKVLYMIDDTGNKAEVRPWLQDFTASWLRHYLNYGKNEVRGQIQAVYDAGYNEWLLWNAGINYTKDALLQE